MNNYTKLIIEKFFSSPISHDSSEYKFISIIGSWGSGKSTLKNKLLVELPRILDTTAHVVDYTAIQYEESSQVTSQLYNAIAKSLPYKLKSAFKIASILKKESFGNKIGFESILIGVIFASLLFILKQWWSYFGDLTKFTQLILLSISTILSILMIIFRHSLIDTLAIFIPYKSHIEVLSKFGIKKDKTRIILMVDEIDRLSPESLKLLLNELITIDSTLNQNNTKFQAFLFYDHDTVISLLKQSNISNPYYYLQKYSEYFIKLKRNSFITQLQKIFIDAFNTDNNLQKVNSIIEPIPSYEVLNFVDNGLRSFRDMDRFGIELVNNFNIFISNLQDDQNINLQIDMYTIILFFKFRYDIQLSFTNVDLDFSNRKKTQTKTEWSKLLFTDLNQLIVDKEDGLNKINLNDLKQIFENYYPININDIKKVSNIFSDLLFSKFNHQGTNIPYLENNQIDIKAFIITNIEDISVNLDKYLLSEELKNSLKLNCDNETYFNILEEIIQHVTNYIIGHIEFGNYTIKKLESFYDGCINAVLIFMVHTIDNNRIISLLNKYKNKQEFSPLFIIIFSKIFFSKKYIKLVQYPFTTVQIDYVKSFVDFIYNENKIDLKNKNQSVFLLDSFSCMIHSMNNNDVTQNILTLIKKIIVIFVEDNEEKYMIYTFFSYAANCTLDSQILRIIHDILIKINAIDKIKEYIHKDRQRTFYFARNNIRLKICNYILERPELMKNSQAMFKQQFYDWHTI